MKQQLKCQKILKLTNSTEKREILTFEGSFHGRTLTTISATAQPSISRDLNHYRGFPYCPFNDFEKLRK
ncbi:MAG: hypothetical protein Ct9H300mP28_05430 [Pseudomonadota bacterium]|nr:MAG: hypothetical protein Ct9H300mP28_05430 [Pseudomonadota bacterium]